MCLVAWCAWWCGVLDGVVCLVVWCALWCGVLCGVVWLVMMVWLLLAGVVENGDVADGDGGVASGDGLADHERRN